MRLIALVEHCFVWNKMALYFSNDSGLALKRVSQPSVRCGGPFLQIGFCVFTLSQASHWLRRKESHVNSWKNRNLGVQFGNSIAATKLKTKETKTRSCISTFVWQFRPYSAPAIILIVAKAAESNDLITITVSKRWCDEYSNLQKLAKLSRQRKKAISHLAILTWQLPWFPITKPFYNFLDTIFPCQNTTVFETTSYVRPKNSY